MKKRKPWEPRILGSLAAAVLALAWLPGCGETSGPVSDHINEVAFNFSGTYRHADGSSPIVTGNSGPRIRRFFVNQTGNLLAFTDEHNHVYSGHLAPPLSVDGASPVSQFVVEGQSPAQVRVAIHGTLRNMGAQNAINAQWVEEIGNKGIVQAVAVSVFSTTTTGGTTTRVTTTTVNVVP